MRQRQEVQALLRQKSVETAGTCGGGTGVSREKLMEQLWETDCFVDENTLSVNVNRLRKRLESAGLSDFIRTKFGVGYLIED